VKFHPVSFLLTTLHAEVPAFPAQQYHEAQF